MHQHQKTTQQSSSIISEKTQSKTTQNQLQHKQIQKTSLNKLKQNILDSLNKVKCQSGKQAKLVCSSPSCYRSSNKFVCYNQNCKCSESHKNCGLIQTQYFNQDILSNLIDTQELIKKVDSTFDKIIDEISDFRIKLIDKIRLSFGLTLKQSNYINQLKKQKYGSIWIQIQRIVNQKGTSRQGRIRTKESELRLQIQSFHSLLKPRYNQIQVQIYKTCQRFYPQSCFSSKIVQTKDQKQFLYKTLKQVINFQKVSLLYRATENAFSTLKFKEKCNQKSNLLILVKNFKDKKYGAFTPCTYKSAQVNVYQQDDSMKSFLFAISDKIKFKLIKKEFALQNSNTKDHILSFGQNNACCMQITTNAHTSKNNWFNPSSAYQKNSKFPCGGYYHKNRNYTLDQYQVYQLHEK